VQRMPLPPQLRLATDVLLLAAWGQVSSASCPSLRHPTAHPPPSPPPGEPRHRDARPRGARPPRLGSPGRRAHPLLRRPLHAACMQSATHRQAARARPLACCAPGGGPRRALSTVGVALLHAWRRRSG